MLTYTLRVLNQIMLGSIKKIPITSPYQVPFRCWPLDMDLFMHLNNASYFRVAELARWRMFPQSNMTSFAGSMFLVVEQSIKYIRPIGPFQSYVVSTKLSSSDDKWIHHEHTFQQHPKDVKKGKEPAVFAVIDCKAVVKEKSGKTIRPSQIVQQSVYYREMLKLHEEQQQEQQQS